MALKRLYVHQSRYRELLDGFGAIVDEYVIGDGLEPEVTIRRTERETVYEYRRNGQLFLVRVQPRFGPPYHFVDVNGDGDLDYRPGDPVRDNIHQWILWRW